MDAAGTASGFDTMAIVRKLEAAGIDRKQAEAHTEALRDGRAGLATKADIVRLKEKLEEKITNMVTKGDFYRALCIQTGVILAVVAGLKLFG